VRDVARLTAIAAVLAASAAPAGAATTMVVATEDDPDSLDPALAYQSDAWQVLANCGEGLVAYRRAAGRAGAEVVPALAEAMPRVSPDGRRLVFTLRAGARFGPPASRAVRPSDVKASIERLFLVRSPGRGLFRSLVGAGELERTRRGGLPGVVARDDRRQVEFRLTASDPSFLRVLALPFAFVVPQDTPASDQGVAGLPTAGPYRIAGYQRGSRIELEANPGYVPGAAGPARPGPERIEVRMGLDAAAGVRGVARGTVDYVQARPSAGDLVAARAAGSGARVHRWVEGTTYYFYMNTRRAPFDDARVRRAVNLALDRSALAAEFRGAAVPSSQVLPPGVPGRRDLEPAPAPDLDGARALVRAAGAAGAPVVVWGHATEPSPAVTERLAETLRAIGLRATTRLWERSEMLSALSDPAAASQIGYARWRQDYPDGADWYPLLLSSAAIREGGNLNYALIGDAGLDRLISRAARTWDPAVRAARWAGVGRAVARLAPWAPFANSVRADITSSRVRGYVAHQLYGFLWMRARVAKS
jgi:peptide/nickel transport system substrate-binding protein